MNFSKKRTLWGSVSVWDNGPPPYPQIFNSWSFLPESPIHIIMIFWIVMTLVIVMTVWSKVIKCVQMSCDGDGSGADYISPDHACTLRPEKTVLGVPLYGRAFSLLNPNSNRCARIFKSTIILTTNIPMMEWRFSHVCIFFRMGAPARDTSFQVIIIMFLPSPNWWWCSFVTLSDQLAEPKRWLCHQQMFYHFQIILTTSWKPILSLTNNIFNDRVYILISTSHANEHLYKEHPCTGPPFEIGVKEVKSSQ